MRRNFIFMAHCRIMSYKILIYTLCLFCFTACRNKSVNSSSEGSADAAKQDSSFAPKKDDYLIAYADTINGEERFGYKDRKGRVTIPAKYLVAGDTLYNMAIVLQASPDHEFVAINKNGEILFRPFIYDSGPDYVVEGVFRFVDNNKMGFANLKGERVIPATFDFVRPFKNGLAEYTLGGKNVRSGEHWVWEGGYENGFVNHSGQRFKEIGPFNARDQSRAAWTDKNKQVKINIKGEIIP